MTTDPTLPQTLASDAAQRQPLSVLTRWLSPASTTSTDAMLGYESALPWTLGFDALAEAREPRY